MSCWKGFCFWRNGPNFNNLLHYRRETDDETCQSSGWNTVFPTSPWMRKQENAGERLFFCRETHFLEKFGSEYEIWCSVQVWTLIHWCWRQSWTYSHYSKLNLAVTIFQLYHGYLVLVKAICDLTMEGNSMKRMYSLRLYKCTGYFIFSFTSDWTKHFTYAINSINTH